MSVLQVTFFQGTNQDVVQFAADSISLNNHTYELVTRDGITFIAAVRLSAYPVGEDAAAALLVIGQTGDPDSYISFFVGTSGGLGSEICTSEGCAGVESETRLAVDTWYVAAMRYKYSSKQLEVWLDEKMVSWPQTVEKMTSVRSVCRMSILW